LNNRKWHYFRVGFDKPKDQKFADGKPTSEEKGILYFGSFKDEIGSRDKPVSISFFSKNPPGYINVQGNNFARMLIGPTPPQKQKPLPRGILTKLKKSKRKK